MSLADFDTGCKTGEMRPGRFVRIVGGETLVCTHGTYESRYKAQTGRRTSAKAEEELEKEEGSLRYARLEQEREQGELVERRIERGFENLAPEPDEEERALLFDGGSERAVRLMREASVVEEEKPRKRRGGDNDDLDEPVKKGIQWKPLAFLVLMVLPGLAPVLINVADRLQAYGFKMPSFSANPYRPCLQEYYADWAPEKLGTLDETLAKYEGKERQLFGALKNKYGKPVNFARCAPPKEK